jgi:hypothetical protein
MTQQKLMVVNEKLNDLLRIKDMLQVYIHQCDSNEQAGECPIIQSFKNNS